jgi:hypothetical protein
MSKKPPQSCQTWLSTGGWTFQHTDIYNIYYLWPTWHTCCFFLDNQQASICIFKVRQLAGFVPFPNKGGRWSNGATLSLPPKPGAGSVGRATTIAYQTAAIDSVHKCQRAMLQRFVQDAAMKKKLYPLFSQVFRMLFTGRCYCCAFAFVGLLVLHVTGVADKDIGGEPQPDLKAVELLMSADENFKKDNSPSNRMALIEVLLTFKEESLRIQAADHAKQLIRELPDDPEACNLYCKSALLIQDV